MKKFKEYIATKPKSVAALLWALVLGAMFFVMIEGVGWVLIAILVWGAKVNVFANIKGEYCFLIFLAAAVMVGAYSGYVYYFKLSSSGLSSQKRFTGKPIYKNKENCNIIAEKNGEFSQEGFVINSVNKAENVICNITEKRSVLLQGQTGSGKTTKVIIPSVINLLNSQNKPSLFIADPKSEIFEQTGYLAKKNGYQIKVINLRNDKLTDSWNPLAKILNVFKEAGEIEAGKLINKFIKKLCLCNNTRDKNNIWVNNAMVLGEAVLKVYLELLKEDQKLELEYFNWKTFRTFVANVNILKKYAEEKLGKNNSGYITLNNAIPSKVGDNVNSGFITNLLNAINQFANEYKEVYIESDGVLLETFRAQPTIIYVIVNDEEVNNDSFTSILIQTLWEELLVGTNSKRKCYFLLDEFANLPKIENLSNKLSNSRGRNIFLLLATQSFRPLDEKYGYKAHYNVVANTDLLVLGTNDMEDARLLSELCGKKMTKVLASENSSTERQGTNHTYQHQEKEYFSVDDFTNLFEHKLAIYRSLSGGSGKLVKFVPCYEFKMKHEKLNYPVTQKIKSNFFINLQLWLDEKPEKEKQAKKEAKTKEYKVKKEQAKIERNQHKTNQNKKQQIPNQK